MAIRHGLAGQYGKSEAGRRARNIINGSIAGAGYGCALLGWAYGYYWGRYSAVMGTVAVILAAAVFTLPWRFAILPLIDRVAKDRIKYLRGGQGEALIAWLLEDLDDDWHIFNGIKLEKDSDIDHVLVGPAGIFCISTKSQRGVFTGTVDGLLYNGSPSPFAQQALRQTMDLKDRLGIAMGKDVPWVQPVLAVPFGFTEQNACGGKVMLVHQDNVVDRLVPDDGPKKFNKQQIARTVKVLEIIQSGAAEVYQRPTGTR